MCALEYWQHQDTDVQVQSIMHESTNHPQYLRAIDCLSNANCKPFFDEICHISGSIISPGQYAEQIFVIILNVAWVWKSSVTIHSLLYDFYVWLISIMQSNQILICVNSGNTAWYDRAFFLLCWFCFWVILLLLCFVIYSSRFCIEDFFLSLQLGVFLS